MKASGWAALLLVVFSAVLLASRAVGGSIGGAAAPLPTCVLPTALDGLGCLTPCPSVVIGLACELTPLPTGTPEQTNTPVNTGTPAETATPTETATGSPAPIATPTLTPTSVPPEDTPTPTEAPPSPTASPTETLLPEPTATPTPAGLTGDVDCDRTVNTIDAALVLQYDAGLLASLACQHIGDVNGDGRVNSIDASFILQYTASLIQHLPPVQQFEGTVIVVRGAEAFCMALDTGRERLVFWDPTGLSVGQRVRVTGFIDPFASFCGITPLLHNLSIEIIE